MWRVSVRERSQTAQRHANGQTESIGTMQGTITCCVSSNTADDVICKTAFCVGLRTSNDYFRDEVFTARYEPNL